MTNILLPEALQQPFKGILFDLDGTLIDSEDLHYRAFVEAMKEHGYDFDALAEENTYKGSFRQMFIDISKKLQFDEEKFDYIYARKMELTIEWHDNQVQEIDGALSFLELMVERKVPMGVVTNSDREYAEHALTQHGLHEYFQHLVTATDLEHAKPAPDGYLRGAELLGLDASDIIVFENTDAGITAARAATMKVIGLRTDALGYSNYEQAHHTIDTFSDTSIDELQFKL